MKYITYKLLIINILLSINAIAQNEKVVVSGKIGSPLVGGKVYLFGVNTFLLRESKGIE